MKHIIDNVGVDAGIIIVSCMSYLEDCKDTKPPKPSLVREVDNGTYEVCWAIPNTWNGSISGKETIKVTSGEIFVTDPCYVIAIGEHEDWMDWLDETDYGNHVPSEKAFSIDSMGGDGRYQVILILEKIGD
jgi:hypothetical protein